jgi:ABC-2 type transport system permease protein
MKPILRILAATVCIIIIAACGSIIFNRLVGRTRLDLTEYRMYSLSDGTKKVVQRLNRPITLKLYYAHTAANKGPEQIRFYNTYYIYVRDLLEEYVGLSGGQLTLEVIDPRPYTDEEEAAIRSGVQKFPLSESENFFFGLVARTELGKEETIGFFEPNRQEFVEYDISKLLVKVTQRDQQKVGVLSSLPVMGADMSPYMIQMMRMQGRTPPPPWEIIARLRDEYEVVSVKADAETLADDLDFLMVIHPKQLSEPMLFAIDQFVMRGGKLLVFVDPHAAGDQPPQDPQNPYAAMNHQAASNLNALTTKWGVVMEQGAIAVDPRLASRIPQRDQIVTMPAFLGLTQDCVNAEEPVVAQLHALRMYFPGVLKPVTGTESTVAPLLTTTSSGGTWTPANPFELQMPDPEAILRGFRPSPEPVMLAARITGKLKSNFPDGIVVSDPEKPEDEAADAEKPKPEAPSERRLTAIPQATEEVTVMVFADVDMVWDPLAYEDGLFRKVESGDNAPVVFNALEFLGDAGDLIAIRSRGRYQRPFVVVDEIEAEAEKATAKEAAAIRQKIASYEAKLRELEQQSGGQDRESLGQAALTEYRKIQDEIRLANTELRKLNAEKLKDIDRLKTTLQVHNMVWAPAVVLLIAIGLSIGRYVRARHYAARRT